MPQKQNHNLAHSEAKKKKNARRCLLIAENKTSLPCKLIFRNSSLEILYFRTFAIPLKESPFENSRTLQT